MADETKTQPTDGKKDEPTVKDDIIDDLFGDKKDDTDNSTDDDDSKNSPDPDQKDDTTTQVDDDVKKKEKEALDRIDRTAKETEKRLQERVRIIERTQELQEFFLTADGQLFTEYKSYIEKAAFNPDYSRFKISQIPAMILKSDAYSRVLSNARQKADAKARDSRIGGSTPDMSARSVSSEENPYSVENMSPADFKEQVKQNRLRGRRA